MQVIDFSKKGNVVRFYLGEKTTQWGFTDPNYRDWHGTTPDWLKPSDTYYGDDWNDRPYDCNAGQVYDEFIKATIDIAFPFDYVVLEPCEGDWNHNCRWSKDDMKNEHVPCIAAIKLDNEEASWKYDDFNIIANMKESIKIYFNDDITDLLKIKNTLDTQISFTPNSF